ncbi:MAG: DUF4760 domain-containing protein [Ahrensia sp.]
MWANLPNLTPLILIVSAAFAYVSIKSAARTARQKATLDLIEKFETDEKYRRIQKTFKRYRNESRLGRLHAPAISAEKTDRQDILDFLNHYELIAIGIKNETLDGDFYGLWMKGVVVRDWNDAADFIQRERWKYSNKDGKWVYYDQIFANFGWLAWHWDVKARRLTRYSSSPPANAEGPGDRDYRDPLTMVNQS